MQQFKAQRGRPRGDLPALVAELGLDQGVLNQPWVELSVSATLLLCQDYRLMRGWLLMRACAEYLLIQEKGKGMQDRPLHPWLGVKKQTLNSIAYLHS